MAVNDLWAELLERSEQRAVFVKDMAYHAEPLITDELIRRSRHTFLIRDLRCSIPSLFRMRSDYLEDQTGFQGLHRLFHRLRQTNGAAPLLMDAQHLTESPRLMVRAYFDHLGLDMSPDLLSWPVGSLEAWAGRESWHVRAIDSQGFERVTNRPASDSLPTKVLRSISRDLPCYQGLLDYAVVPSRDSAS